jgi:hypothetical protein
VNTVEERGMERRLRQMFEAVARDTSADVPPVGFMREDSDAIRALAPNSRSRPWRFVAAFVVVLALVGAVALVVLNRSSDTHSGVAASPTSLPQPDRHPNRIALPLADGSNGWINTKALSPPNLDGLNLAEGLARSERFQHRLIPVTKTVDPKSSRIGYYLINVGFVPLAVTRTPGFSVDALIAHGRCTPATTQIALIDGSYQCVNPTGPKLGSRLR